MSKMESEKTHLQPQSFPLEKWYFVYSELLIKFQAWIIKEYFGYQDRQQKSMTWNSYLKMVRDMFSFHYSMNVSNS